MNSQNLQELKSEEFFLNGEYEMVLKIDGSHHLFKDVMYLNPHSPISSHTFSGDLFGKIIVPDIFEAPLSGKGFCLPLEKKAEFEFSILAKEKGEEFKVFYKAKISPENFEQKQCILEGDAYLENGKKMGTFVARKKM